MTAGGMRGTRKGDRTGSRHGDPATRTPYPVLRLLARADGELVAATMCSQPWERYLHAHLAALRAAAAVLAVRGRPSGRGLPADAWGLARLVAPELAAGWARFAAGAPVRAAIEAGRLHAVDGTAAAEALAAASELVDAVRALVEETVAGPAVARAS